MLKKGFTLAEVLITIVILGIIAAITLPAINSNVNKQTLEKQTQKFYTQFGKAINLYKVDNETDSITEMDFDPQDFVKEYFSVTQKCTDDDKCYADLYAALSGSNTYTKSNWTDETTYTYALPDGSVFSIAYNDEDDVAPLTVYFDVNGKKGPNKVGNDLWFFKVYSDGSIDEEDITPDVRREGDNVTTLVEEKFNSCKEGGLTGCFGHFMRNHFKFDY